MGLVTESGWFEPLCGLLGPAHGEALIRRTRYLGHALEPTRAAALLDTLDDTRLEFERDGFVGSVIEVFDAGPPSSETWR